MSSRFPALPPSEHPTITAGRFPHVERRSTGGRSARIRLGNVQIDGEIVLPYRNISTLELFQLRGHWREARGTSRDFALPEELFPSMDAATRARLMATAWRYKEPPKVVDICAGTPNDLLHTVEITLRAQPRRVLSPVLQDLPSLSLPVVPSTAPGARLSIRLSSLAGLPGIDAINAPGAVSTVRLSFLSGGASATATTAPSGVSTLTLGSVPGGVTTPGATGRVLLSATGGGARVEGPAPGSQRGLTLGSSPGGASVEQRPPGGGSGTLTLGSLSGAGTLSGGTAPGSALSLTLSAAPGQGQSAPGGAASSLILSGIGGGVQSTGDPQFSSVSLLLPFDGANNSTTFTDASLNALVPAAVNGATRIRTAQSKWGGASAFFDANTSWIRYTPQAALEFSGLFTIELWIFQTILADKILASSSSDTNTQIFRVHQVNFGDLSFFLNGVQVFGPTPAGITANAWHHLALCRSATGTRMFVNGLQKGSTNTSWSGSFRMDVIGTFFFGGSHLSSTYDYLGYIDDLRVTKGVARYTADFTPPSGPHPTA